MAGELPGVLQGHGRSFVRNDSGAEESEQGLQQSELLLGNEKSASENQANEPANILRRRNPVPQGLGTEERYVRGDADKSAQSRMVGETGFNNRRAEESAVEVLGPQELGGLLNSTIARALEEKRKRDVQLRIMLYDIQQHGKKHVDWRATPRAERRKLLEEVVKHLPPEVFHLSEEANTSEAAKQLWEKVKAEQHPLTREGIVVWPHTGRPLKAKLFDDYDVHISNVFPGEGKYQGVGAGGFEYSLKPGGPIIGRVGTGFSDETRRDLLANPSNYIGRVAKIRSQEQFPTGAFRAPAFLALHEDYPTTAKIAEDDEGEADAAED
jgi:hypothetical protein